MQNYIGAIIMTGYTFSQPHYAFCNGTMLAINDHQALFSLIGTTYGGDGVTNFALPDLRGRIPMHTGTGGGLTPRPQGQKAGLEEVTVTTAEMPNHSHDWMVSPSTPDTYDPLQRMVGKGEYYTKDTAVTVRQIAPDSIENTGGNESHPNMMPVMCINFQIALDGVYPSRN